MHAYVCPAQTQALPCRFISIEDDSALKGNKELEIRVKADPDAKTITIECAHRLLDAATP